MCVSQGLQCKEGAINLVFITQTFANLSLNLFWGTNFSNSGQDTYDQICSRYKKIISINWIMKDQ